jgi:large subunit ribosomal protein L1
MSKLPKRKQAWEKLREHNKNYPVLDAFKILKQAATAKFDEAVDVAINLGIDAKKSDQTVRLGPDESRERRCGSRYSQGDKAKAAGMRAISSAWKIRRGVKAGRSTSTS